VVLCNDFVIIYYSLTAHGITKDWQRIKFVLSIASFPGSHTNDLVAAKIQEMLDDWKIPAEKVHAFVDDQGSNYRVAFRDRLTYADSNCAAHKINLVVRNSLFEDPTAKKALEKARKIVGHFKHSNLACDKLKEAQDEEDLLFHKLIQVNIKIFIDINLKFQDFVTRWNSTFLMCKRLIEQRRAIQRYLAGHEKISVRALDLSEDEWSLIAAFETLLNPFDEATAILCRDSASISLQLPLAKLIHAKLLTLEVPSFLIAVKDKMCQLLKDKFFDLETDRYV
jgi:hypothetical protein